MLYSYHKHAFIFIALLSVLIQCHKKDKSPSAKEIDKTITYLSDVLFTDQQHGYVTGGNGVILRTKDGGNTWIHRNYADDEANTNGFYPDLTDVFFTDSKIGWACGGNNGMGIVFKTVDGGVNWTHVNVPSNQVQILTKIYFTDHLNGFAIGNDNYSISLNYLTLCEAPLPGGSECAKTSLLKTKDGGNTWNKVTLPSDSSIFSLTFSDSQHGYICGEYGLLMYTTDGGSSWAKQNLIFTNRTTTDSVVTKKNHLTDIIFTTADTGYIVSASNYMVSTIFKTTDGGVSWNDVGLFSVYSLFKNSELLYFPKFGFYNDKSIVLYEDGLRNGGSVSYFLSTDGGFNWYQKQVSGIPLSGDINLIRFGCVNSNTMIGIKRDYTNSNLNSLNKITF